MRDDLQVPRSNVNPRARAYYRVREDYVNVIFSFFLKLSVQNCRFVWVGMISRYSLTIFAIGLLAGCFATRTDPELASSGSQDGTLGDWSAPLGGLRCRLRLQSTH